MRQHARILVRSAGAAGLIAFWVWAVTTAPAIGGKPYGVDAMAYWSASLDAPYSGAAAGLPGAYLYSPAFVEILTPLRWLPWEGFMAVWLAAELVALAWLVTPLGALALLAFPPIASEVLIGNIHTFLAVALVLALTRPWTWTLALLTKPTLGVGLAWYVGRREWRRCLIALGATAATVAVSFVVAPNLWVAWIERLRGAGDRGGEAWAAFLVGRLAVAALIAVVAGWRARPGYLPLAMYVALPIPWLEGLTLLAATPRLVIESYSRGDRPDQAPAPTRRNAPEPRLPASGPST